MSPDAAALRGLLAADAEQVAALLRLGTGERPLRQAARVALSRAWPYLADVDVGEDPLPVSPAPPPAADPAVLALLITAQGEMARLRRALDPGEAGGAGRPIGRVQIRRPMPEFLRMPAGVRGRAGLLARLLDRLRVDLALSEARVRYAEERCGGGPRPFIREIRAGDPETLPDGDFELLRKRGRSPFS